MDAKSLAATTTCLRHGFTLVEVLIVVVIMSIIAATVISQVSSSTQDARDEVLAFNEKALREQIEIYKVHHRGNAPKVAKESLPQLLLSTNEDGEIGEAGPKYPFGPYVCDGQLPINPITGSNAVRAVAKFPTYLPQWQGGWIYHEPTGQIMANLPGSFVKAPSASPSL